MLVSSKDKGRLIRFGPRRVEGAGEPRPGRRPIPMLRARILHSAMELFGERGFEDVPIDDVAARAGVGKGSIYRQFGSKEQLYAASVIEGFAQLRNQIETALAQAASIPDRITTSGPGASSLFCCVTRPSFPGNRKSATAKSAGSSRH
jgi:AcrR family transcriptional regulator